MSEYLKMELERLHDITRGCRDDMHEPDEQDLTARVIGTKFDNAFGVGISLELLENGSQEIVVILEKVESDNFGIERFERFNLATLIALARKAKL